MRKAGDESLTFPPEKSGSDAPRAGQQPRLQFKRETRAPALRQPLPPALPEVHREPPPGPRHSLGVAAALGTARPATNEDLGRGDSMVTPAPRHRGGRPVLPWWREKAHRTSPGTRLCGARGVRPRLPAPAPQGQRGNPTPRPRAPPRAPRPHPRPSRWPRLPARRTPTAPPLALRRVLRGVRTKEEAPRPSGRRRSLSSAPRSAQDREADRTHLRKLSPRPSAAAPRGPRSPPRTASRER